MNNMDDWNTNQHARTGLTEQVKASTIRCARDDNRVFVKIHRS